MPVLFPCPAEWQQSGTAMTESFPGLPSRNCTVFLPKSDTNPLSVLMLDTSDPSYPLCYFKTTSGREVWFKSFEVSTSDALLAQIPQISLKSNCTCSKVLDVAIVLDRRTSVTAKNFALEKSFIQGIINKTGISPSQVTYTIVNYNTYAWTSLYVNEGVTLANVNTSLKSITCLANCTTACCANPYSWTCDSCACGGASVSSGILMAATNLAASARVNYSTKVMIVITSNYQDMLSSGDGDARKCYPKCNFPIGTDAWIGCATPSMDVCHADLQ